MDVIKVDIKSKDTIRPSSPTPHSLRHLKLSLLDQLSPAEYVPMIFYYAEIDDSTGLRAQAKIGCLKKSLSEALTEFYPLAGKVRDNQFVECNDYGAEFIEAEVNCALLEILRLPKVEVLDQLLPRDYHIARSSTEFQLAVQVNAFTCGGLAIGLCTLHKLIDGVTFTSLVNTWAAKSRGSGDHLSPTFVGPQLFPQKDLSGLLPTLDIPKDKCLTKIFVFNGSKIASLREEIASHFCGDRPSRNEVISALIWKCAMNASRARSGSFVSSVLTQTVNLRARINPPLSESCAGNLLWLAMAPGSNQIGLHDLVNEIRKSIKKFDREHVRKMQGESGFSLIFESLKQIVELVSANVDIYRFTSLGKFQLYEADFGWGKPVWVSSAGLIFKNVVVLIESRYGDGIEAWVTMEEKDMAVFERNQELLAFASATASPSCLLPNSRL